MNDPYPFCWASDSGLFEARLGFYRIVARSRCQASGVMGKSEMRYTARCRANILRVTRHCSVALLDQADQYSM